MNNTIPCPCLGCTERKLYCHSTCKGYLEFQRLNNERLKEIRRQGDINDTLIKGHARIQGNREIIRKMTRRTT